jgi:hypothetical protein
MREVKYKKNFDFKAGPSLVKFRREGRIYKISEAEFTQAEKADAVEVIRVQGPKQGAASKEDGGSSEKS